MTQVIEAAAANITANISSLYVGDLKPEISEQTLWNAFAAHGQITGVRICRDSNTHISLGYGYVNFRSSAEAEKAMISLNLTPIEGKPCRIMWCMRDPSRRKNGAGNLYIKNIDSSVDSRALYDAFLAFGPIMSCKLALDENGRNKGFGFIQFLHEKDADQALEKANGVEFMNKTIVITKFLTKNQRTQMSGGPANRYTNVFVKNFKDQWTLDDLKKAFSTFGEITSCYIKTDQEGKSAGFGFVNFSTPEFAAEAVKKMNGFKLTSGLELCVDRAQKKSERAALLKSKNEKRRLECHRRFHKLNLYVKNFDNFTDDTLKAEFAQYGQIQSARVMKDETGKSKGFGFVCFAKGEDADKALTAMQTKLHEGKPLYVSYAQNREERRKMIQQRIYNAPFNRSGPNFPPNAFPFMYPNIQPYYPPPRYPYNNMSQRQNTRNPLPGVPIVQNYNMRPMMGSQMQGNFYSPHGGHRIRNPSNPQQSRGYSSGPVRQQYQQHSMNYQPRNSIEPQMVAVNNHVTTEQALPSTTRPKKEETKLESKSVEQVSTVDDIGNHIYHLAQKVFDADKVDKDLLGKLTAAVMDKFKKTGTKVAPSDEDIRKNLQDAYSQYKVQTASNPAVAT